MKGKTILNDPYLILRNSRKAFNKNAAVLLQNRAKIAGQIMDYVVARRQEIASVVSSETGKTIPEAILSDVLPTLEMLHYLMFEADRVLQDKHVKTPMIFLKSRSYIQYKPRGIVLIISPWNNPFQLSLIPTMTALAAGNAVILKPSEKTPNTALLIQDIFMKSELENELLQVVIGGSELGKALIEAGPDMIFFTGSSKTGMNVLSQASKQLIPVILELGGKDAMLVFEDAHLERASRAALYGAFTYAGQHCVSIKRLFVQKRVYSQFISLLHDKTRALAATNHWGKATDQRAIESAKRQIIEALQRGACLLIPEDPQKAGNVPTIVLDCSSDMAIMQQETFAPVLPVIKFDTEEDAIRLANESPFGLNASIWTSDENRAGRIARKLLTGNLFVNNVLVNIGNPYLPFGGIKFSGIGKYHGEAGLKAFCIETSVMVSRNKNPDELHWFPHNSKKMNMVDDLILLRYGKMGFWKGLTKWFDLWKRTKRKQTNDLE